MSTTFRTLLSAGLCASLLTFAGCAGDDTGDTDSSTTTPTATTPTTTPTSTDATTTMTSGETDPTEGTGSTGSTTEDPTEDPTEGGGGFCALGCSEAADCCADGVPDCPSDAYPNNWSCNAGFCEFGGCSTDDECTMGGILEGWECHELGGVGGCVNPCADDDACEAMVPGWTCSFEYDDGTKGCAPPPVDPEPCTEDADCGGFGVCNADSGACECSGDAECSTEGYNCKM